jgi:multidrug efflux system membrane fusion protein
MHGRTVIVFLLVLIIILGLAGGGYYYFTKVMPQQAQANTAPAFMPPPPSVEVITVQPQEERFWTRYSGRLAAVESAEIRPMVSGEIMKVYFEDGERVKKGAPLFLIDPRSHAAKVKQAEAQLSSALSQEKLAQDEYKRTEQLLAKKLISESVFDEAKNLLNVAKANVLEAESAITDAKVTLDRAQIKAPFDGKMGRAELTVGNMVEGEMNAPVMASIVADDQLYAEFDVDESNYIQIIKRKQQNESVPVTMTLAVDESVIYKGKIHSFDNQLDASSGTIRARAVFDNSDGILVPGMYVNVALGEAEEKTVLLVPEKAVGTNQSMKYVSVVDENNVVSFRPVELGQYINGKRVVLSGLAANERIVVNGLSHVRPGVTVQPVDASVE